MFLRVPTYLHASSKPTGFMKPRKQCFDDLDRLIDCVHELFGELEKEAQAQAAIESMLDQTKLALHEWLANLVQHADFNDRTPRVKVEVIPNGQSIKCVVEDNSTGFDFDRQLDTREEMLTSFPERGMGLLMIKACAAELSYQSPAPDRHCLRFTVSADNEPTLRIPF